MKLKKNHCTKFDYLAKKVFIVSVIALIAVIAFIVPLKASFEEKCLKLTNEVQTLENQKGVLLNELEEFENPTVMINDKD